MRYFYKPLPRKKKNNAGNLNSTMFHIKFCYYLQKLPLECVEQFSFFYIWFFFSELKQNVPNIHCAGFLALLGLFANGILIKVKSKKFNR